MVGEDTEVPHLMLTRGRHEPDQAREEALGLEIDVGRTRARGRFEDEPDASIGEGADSIVGKGRPQQVAQHPLEPLAIAAVDDGGGMQRHAEGGDLERPWCRWSDDTRWSLERELHAPGECRVDIVIVIVVVDAAKPTMDGGKHLREVVLGRSRRGEPAHGHAIFALGLELELGLGLGLGLGLEP